MASVSYAVDVSDNQPAHQPWKSFGVHMGIAKASEGERSRDEWFLRHIADIRAAGLVPCGYHFAWPNQDVAKEAANYIAAVKPVAGPGMVHALDLEPYPNGAKNYAGRTDAQIEKWSTAWVAAVRKAYPDQRILGYTPRDNYAKHYPAGTDGYWYPAYPVQGRTFAQAATITRPVIGGTPVWGWQFTSIPRDQTVIYMSPAALRAWAAGTTQEDDMPTAEEIAAAVWAHPMVSPTSRQSHSAETFVRYQDQHFAAVMQRLAAMDAAITTLASLAGKQVDTAQVVAAVQAAIADAVVHVDVNVTGAPAQP